MSNKTIPPSIARVFKSWTRQAQLLRSGYAILVLAGVSGSILAAAELGKAWSLLAAIAISLVAAFDLQQKANGFRRGWRILHAALMRFETDPQFSEAKLISEYERAEQAIGDVTGVAKRDANAGAA